MSRRRTAALAGVCAVLFGFESAGAQIWKKPIEIGVDGQLTFVTGDNSSTSLSVPANTFRIGLQLTDKVAIEPALSLDFFSSDGGHATFYGVGTGLVWNFSADRTKRQWYLRPFALMWGVEGNEGVSESQFAVGAGFGIRCPLTSLLAARVEANVGQWLKKGDLPAQTEFGLNFGLSLWTK